MIAARDALRKVAPDAELEVHSMLIRLTPNATIASMSHMKNITIWQVVEGKRRAGGKVLKTFTSDIAYKCGGPATASLRESQRLARKGVECHARRYYPDLHGPLATSSN